MSDSAELWDPNSSESDYGVLLVSSQDQDLLEIALEDNAFGADQIFVVASDIEARVIQHFLKCSLAIDPKYEFAGNSAAGEAFERLFTLWKNFLQAFDDCDLDWVKRLGAEIVLCQPTNFALWRTEALINVLTDITRFRNEFFIVGSPVGIVPLSQRSQTWWEDTLAVLEKCRTILSQTSESGLSNWEGLAEHVVRPLSKLEKALKHWKSAKGGNGLFFSACYFLATAEHWWRRGEGNLSVIYSHRALETFYMYWSWNEGTVEKTPSGLKFTHSARRNERVSIWAMENQLHRERDWQGTAIRKKFIGNLNRARNLLKLAHGIYAAGESDAQVAIEGVRAIISDVEASTKWKANVAAFTIFPHVSDRTLFDVEDCFEDYVRPFTP